MRQEMERTEHIISVEELNIFGAHNYENVMAAVATLRWHGRADGDYPGGTERLSCSGTPYRVCAAKRMTCALLQ